MSREVAIGIGIYLAVINLIGLILMGADKSKAKKHLWRIPEKTFFLISFLGGALGCWIGMYQFRHKTKHKKFVYGIPAILLFHVVVFVVLLVNHVI